MQGQFGVACASKQGSLFGFPGRSIQHSNGLAVKALPSRAYSSVLRGGGKVFGVSRGIGVSWRCVAFPLMGRATKHSTAS